MPGKSLPSFREEALSRDLVRAWRTWQNTPPPTENFRAGADSVPTWQIECDLDHLSTWICGLGTARLEGRRCDFARMAAEDMAELWRIELELERVAMPDKDKQKYRKYIGLTRWLLDEIIQSQKPVADAREEFSLS